MSSGTLIMSLYRKYDSLYKAGKKTGKVHVRRVRVMKEIFYRSFPETSLREPVLIGPNGSEWQFILKECEVDHIEWARHAWKCGLIDAYTNVEVTKEKKTFFDYMKNEWVVQ